MIADEPLLTRDDARAVDEELARAGVPGVLLMENAGRGACDEALRALGRAPGAAVILVGPGNNGGDALVLARHLRARHPKATLRVVALSDPAAMRGDAAVMRDALAAAGVSVTTARDDAGSIAALLDGADMVVDGMFGTGLTRPLEGVARSLARAVNARSLGCVVALDVPSGLDANTGAALGSRHDLLRATLTCTFAAAKPGLFTGDGVEACGEVRVVGLGAPIPLSRFVIRAWRSTHRPPEARSLGAHKGVAGHVLVIGGSEGKTGAALLAARGAHRAGAGLVTLASTAARSLDLRVVETMTAPLSRDLGALHAELDALLRRAKAVVLGPGLGVGVVAQSIVDGVLARCEAPLVIDADALRLAASALQMRASRRLVLTPHPLELARMLDLPGDRPAEAVNADRFAAAREAAARFHAVVVLKGAGTVIAAPDGRAWVLPYADPTLGVAGSGDVLAGALGARLAERDDVLPAVLEAAHAHGLAGAAVRRARGATRGALASEIADALSSCLEGTEG